MNLPGPLPSTRALVMAALLLLPPAFLRAQADPPAGSLDLGFQAPAGAFPADFTPDSLFPTPDGGVLVGGTVNLVPGPSAEPNALVRLRADGSRDDAFHARLPRPDGLYLQPVAVDAAGRTLVFQRGGPGFDFTFGAPIGRFLRLLPDGSVDPGFVGPLPGFGGVPTTAAGPNQADIARVFPLPDGSLLVAGRFTSLDAQRAKFAARLRPDGSVDPAYRVRPPVSKDGFAGTFVQPDGQVVVTDNSRRGFRYRPDGSLGSPLRLDVPTDVYPRAYFIYPLVFQPDGKSLAEVGIDAPGGPPGRRNDALVRLNPDGTLDPAFDAGADLDLRPTAAYFGPAAVQPDGRVLVALVPADFTRPPKLYRLFANGQLDVSFNAPLGFEVSGPDDVTPFEGRFTALTPAPGGSSLFVAGVTVRASPNHPLGTATPTVARLRLADPLPARANLAVRLVNPALIPRASVAGAFRVRAGLRLLNSGDASVRDVPIAAYLTERTDYATRPFNEAADLSLVKLETLPTVDAAGNLLTLKLRLPNSVGGGPPVGFSTVRKLAAGRAAPLVSLKLDLAVADIPAVRGKTLLVVLDPAGTVAETDRTDNVTVFPLAGLP